MLLQGRTYYLVLHDKNGASGRRVSVATSLGAAIKRWTPGSRVSPIWQMRIGEEASRRPSIPAGQCILTFVGPVQPARLPQEVSGLKSPSLAGLWLTAGCFNAVLQTSADGDGKRLAEGILKWAGQAGVAAEQWSLEDGVITEVAIHQLVTTGLQPKLKLLAEFPNGSDHPVLRPAFQENRVVTATTLARSAAVYPPMFHSLGHVLDANRAIADAFDGKAIGLLDMQSRLLSMNAAISRFSSQALSGTPPIRETECHFWVHSLLGTGSGNIALHNLVSSVQKVLGEARLPERLELLSTMTSGVPTLADLTSSAQLLSFDLMERTLPTDVATQPIVPLITYFSGRDGFSSQLQSLSAPLSTISECNSRRSNLLTVTHEIAHIFVQGVLACLSPSLGNEADLSEANALLQPHHHASDFLGAAKQLFLEALMSMEQVNRDALTAEEIARELPELIGRWRRETQEILVHAFDFLYFHAGDPEYYVSSIWSSWCSIPGIGDRIPECLMRTICAVSANLLGEAPAKRFPAALNDTKRILQALAKEIGIEKSYVEQVLTYVDRIDTDPDLRKQIENEYSVRLLLVRLVRIFLFSETLSARLYADAHIGPGEGYKSKHPLAYELSPIGNALNFLKTQLKLNPSEAESIWVLHCLAFDTEPAGA